MIIEILGFLVLVLLIAFIANLVQDVNKQTNISFREAMDLVELPVITFYNGNHKLNFLLDTGSTHSHINSMIINTIPHKVSNYKIDVSGVEGNTVQNNVCNLKITYKDSTFSDDFIITDLDTTFSIIKSESGVQLHGILGSAFFKKYEYILDFKDLVAYWNGKGDKD